MTIKDEHKVIVLSVLGGVFLWTVDAAVDVFIFSHGSYLDSLLLDMSAHELYFRSFMMLGFMTIGIMVALFTAKRRQIEERYRNIVELSSDIIYMADKDGKYTFMNNAAYRILQTMPEEVVGHSILSIVHPDDRETTERTITACVETDTKEFNLENRYVTKSGKTLTVLHNIRVMRNGRGEFSGMQGIAMDISVRKQGEVELQKAIARTEDEKARSESIIAAIGDGISIQDRDLKVVYQNKAHMDMSGGNRTGEYCYQVYTKTDSLCPDCPVVKTFGDGGIHTLEKTVTLKGETRTIEIKASPLRDASGTIIAGIEAVRDITIRKSTGEKLKLFSAAIAEAMDGVQIVDMDGAIVYSNKAVLDLYGYDPEELNGRAIYEMNTDRDFALQIIMPQIRERGRWSGEFTATHKNGRTFPVWLSASLVNNDQGKPIAAIGIMRDITERKQAEGILKRHHEQLMKLVEERTGELSQANEKLRKEIADRENMEQELMKTQKLESLGILAGGIAHDFNNLLTSIMGNISLAMLDINPKDGAYRSLEGAERASLRAQDLTRQLLTFSKGGAPIKKTMDISGLIREAAGFALRGSHVKCDFIISPDLKHVDVDEGQISQVIHNMMINADHAMPAGGTITIHAENAVLGEPAELPLRAGEYVKIRIQDHGIGISQEYISKIFDPYFTTKQKGSGLGLATSYSIIRKHGGHILAESELGKGAMFTIYLPTSSDAVAVKERDEDRLRKGNGKVLIMDDEPEVRITTGDILKRLGYVVEFAGDGVEAIDLYQQARDSGATFDVVIMDLTVPGGMGGQETLEKLLLIDPDVKAIVSSGYATDPIMSEYRNHGYVGVVTKPYRIEDLSETLFEIVQKSRKRS